MDMLHEPLDIVFRRVRPEELYHQLLAQERGEPIPGCAPHEMVPSCSSQRVLKENLKEKMDPFFRGADELHKHYSHDEVDLIRGRVAQKAKNDKGESSVFNLLPDFTKDILTFKWGDPVCDKSCVFRWRAMSFRLGQDIFTTAHRAKSDWEEDGKTTYFAWPTVIHVNNPVVKEVMEREVAENHSHLYGAVPPSQLSWICLMNHPEDILIYEKNDEFRQDMMTTTQYSDSESRLTWTERLHLAFWLRVQLFLHIRGEANEEYIKHRVLHEFDLMSGNRRSRLRKTANTIRYLYGKTFPQSNGQYKCLDYAFPVQFDADSNNGYYRVLAGERYFLYKCFYEIFAGNFSQYEQDLFYLYLLLKIRFRNELVQINKRVGFRNFLEYQNRKGLLWEHRQEYSAECYRIAINGKMENQKISSQEDRVMPGKTKALTLQKIYKIDKEVIFAKETCDGNIDLKAALLAGQWSSPDIFQKGKTLPNFYTLHFAKRPSNPKEVCGLYPPRNYEARNDAATQALALASALTQYPYLRYRVRGIDACAREIGCRPETFATEFRFLRHFRSTSIAHKKWNGREDEPWPRLCATYHAGEDFLDLIDGMRAIDEAVSFLEFERGDRLGHALALGVDPSQHYKFKDNRVITTKQNRLDDLVWLICRSRDYNVSIPANLLRELEKKANYLLYEIYGEAARSNNWNLTIQDYYDSWELRGDHPDFYTDIELKKSKGYQETVNFAGYHSVKGQYILHKRRKNFELLEKPQIRGLLCFYHFDSKVRDIGNEEYDVWITPDYIRVVRAMQDAIIGELTEKGIYIECNPSSNYLIGTFKQYKDHPIFRFNQYRMNVSNRNHVCVSINTDDMGVFDTSIENEYALIAAALEDMRDEHENRLYDDDFIADYLEHLRMMGHRQTFAPVENYGLKEIGDSQKMGC